MIAIFLLLNYLCELHLDVFSFTPGFLQKIEVNEHMSTGSGFFFGANFCNVVTIFLGGLFVDSLSDKCWSKKKWKNKQNWFLFFFFSFFFFFGGGGECKFEEFAKICYTFHTKKHFANFRTQVTKIFGKFWIYTTEIPKKKKKKLPNRRNHKIECSP